MEATDAAAIADVRAGHSEAFRVLVDRHSRPLFRLAYRLTRNESDADIQLQITWENVASGRRSPPVGVKIPVRKLNRTRAFRTLKIKGAHRAILIDESGKEIAALPFTIE